MQKPVKPKKEKITIEVRQELKADFIVALRNMDTTMTAFFIATMKKAVLNDRRNHREEK